jgi:hypothetical protein
MLLRNLNQYSYGKRNEACPICQAPCVVGISGLALVENTGDETLASKHYKFIGSVAFRNNIEIIIDDTIYTIMRSQVADLGEKGYYTVVMEDAHGAVEISVRSMERLLQGIVRYVEDEHKQACIEAIQAL